jgi:hypothetical protein
MTAEDILRRLTTCGVGQSVDQEALWTVMADARAYLARPKRVMAEVWLSFLPPHNGHPWRVVRRLEGEDTAVLVRIPVPDHILNPPVVEGEVVND